MRFFFFRYMHHSVARVAPRPRTRSSLVALGGRRGKLARVVAPAVQQLARRVPLLRQQPQPLLARCLPKLGVCIPRPQHHARREHTARPWAALVRETVGDTDNASRRPDEDRLHCVLVEVLPAYLQLLPHRRLVKRWRTRLAGHAIHRLDGVGDASLNAPLRAASGPTRPRPH